MNLGTISLWHTRSVHASILLVFGLSFFACHTRDGAEGSIRVADKEVVGIYVTSFHNGSERLELKDNGTYVQEFASNTHPFRSTGKWRLQHEFLDGSSVVLANAVVSEDDEARPLQFGDIILYTHERAGKIVLARNEVADWYYERAE